MRSNLLTASSLFLVAGLAAAPASAQSAQLPGSALKPFATKRLPPLPQPQQNLLASTGADDCANASTTDAISAAGVYAVDTTAATTGGPAAGCGSIGTEVWFYWTPLVSGTATISLCGGAAADTVLALWDANNGTACPSGLPLACNDDNCGVQSQVSTAVVAGQSYFIEIGSFGGGAGFAGTFSIAVAAPPSGDDCAAPLAIGGTGVFPFDNSTSTAGAQGQAEPLCLFFSQLGIDKDLWYDWTCPSTGTATVSLCGGTSVDTKVAVYAGAGCPAGAAIACNDDTCGLQSEVTFACTGGQVYALQVGTYPGAAGGTGSFAISIVTPDDCATPTPISGTGVFPFDNATATAGAQGQLEASCLFFGQTAINHDVWFTWTCPTTGTATLDTCGQTSVDTKIAVYAGAGCPAGAAIACNDDTCSLQSQVSFACTAGQDYTIQLGTWPTAVGGTGTFTIGIVPQIDVFCEGTLADCPCGNVGAPGNGCANSVNAGGAHLAGSGTATVGADTVVLSAAGMPGASGANFCLFVQSSSTGAGAFGDGRQCLGTPFVRLGTRTIVAGSAAFGFGVVGDPLVSVQGAVVPGTYHYQVFYRNAAVFCTADTFNTTNGLTIVWN